ncbi:MAG TPA: response regulator transcription factor [Sediminibacterium sp.]|jgi:DNA-binding NarL/FixJ family response regulator|nr:response regulator transcription factor [Sediminibacterium sp.]HPH36936.1 response regulator transcription factor [Sediminibacterium sp.]
MIRIGIVDDKAINRTIVKQKIAALADACIVLEANNGIDFLEKMRLLEADQLPQIILMDVDMPQMNGIEAITIGSVQYPSIVFLVLSIFDDDDKIFEAIQAGAVGYLLKEDTAVDLGEAIQEALSFNGAPMSPAIARKTLLWLKNMPGIAKQVKERETEILSEREIDILKLMVEGLDYKKIAKQLFISPFTVRAHTRKIYEKLHVHSKAQAIQLAHKYKWV